ncbi:MAG: DNA double-strand break repair nuclease NurA [Anaerolineae bacterium]
MTLEFQKLTEQVDRLGEYIASQEKDDEAKVEIALQIMDTYADPAWLPEIDRRVQDAIDKDAGYRGARPLDEPLLASYPAAPLPESATLVATDGSQILPNTHGAALYYLINIGAIVVHYGSGEPPLITSEPFLLYDRGYLYMENRGLISAAVISARRSVEEMVRLAEYSREQAGMARPLVSLLDGPLLFVMGSEVPDRAPLLRRYFQSMGRLLEIQAGLAGYTDRPRSSFIVSLLHLLDVEEERVSRHMLSTDGRMEGLQDAAIFKYSREPGQPPILPSGHRTAIFVQMSPQNKEFRNEGGDLLEIAFFYMNVAPPDERPQIARIEVPMWVARDHDLVAQMQALIYHQCQQTITRYPYILTRADELAVVKHEESRQLDVMIQVALTRHGLLARESAKQAGKAAARADKTAFDQGA